MLAFLAPLIGRLVAKPLVAKAIGLPWLQIGAVAVALLIGYLKLQHAREVRQLKGEIAAVTQQLQAERTARLKAENVALEYRNNRDNLAADLRRQSDAVGRLSIELKAAEQASTVTALRALERGRAEAEALRQPTSTVAPGHEAMNEWLKARVGQ
jgi:hypothetical protein